MEVDQTGGDEAAPGIEDTVPGRAAAVFGPTTGDGPVLDQGCPPGVPPVVDDRPAPDEDLGGASPLGPRARRIELPPDRG